jgi:hypothetical protein
MAINTLITIRDAIQAFVDGHGQLQSVRFGADDKRAPYLTEQELFPVLYVAPVDVEVGRAHNTHRLRVYVYERLNDADQDEWENANDTSLILRDIRVWWNDYGVDDILIETDPTGTFKTDSELDNLVGYYAEILFQIPSHGRCDVPVSIEPIPPIVGCLPANYVVEYADGTPIESGSIPSGGFEMIIVSNCDPCEDATYQLTLDGEPLEGGSGSIPSGENANIPIDGFIPECDPATVIWNGDTDFPIETLECGEQLNINCETLINGVVVEIEGDESFIGYFRVQAGFPSYTLEGVGTVAYAVNSYAINMPTLPDPIFAEEGTEDFPWLATWQAGVTVRQATISDACCECDEPVCEDATFDINGVQVAIIPSGGSDSIEVRPSSGATQIGSLQGQYWRVADTTVQLRDSAANNIGSVNSYLAESSNNLTAPDGTVTVNRDGVFFAAVDVRSNGTATIDVPSDCPTPSLPQGGMLPFKSGQTTVYETGDDGTTQRGQSFTVLPFTNPYGNTTRFLDTLGGTTYANGITLDLATTQWTSPTTGTFMGYVFVNVSTNWATQVANALAATHGGYSGWSIINDRELVYISVDNGSVNDSLNHSGLLAPDNILIHTGKTNPNSTAQAISRTATGFINALAKSNNGRRIDARMFNFSVSGGVVTLS